MHRVNIKIKIAHWIAVASFSFILACTCYADAEILPVIPINKNMDGWKIKGNPLKNRWTIGVAELDKKDPYKLVVSKVQGQIPQLINSTKGDADIYTTQSFGDCILELEVMVPKKSNSGVYLMGRYEIQIKDSFAKGDSIGTKDMGAVCGFAKPRLNAAAKPGVWQKLYIEFKAPRFENGKKVSAAEFVKVVLNGHVIHEHVKMIKGASSGSMKKRESALGPLMLQGGLGPVAYRNIRIRPDIP